MCVASSFLRFIGWTASLLPMSLDMIHSSQQFRTKSERQATGLVGVQVDLRFLPRDDLESVSWVFLSRSDSLTKPWQLPNETVNYVNLIEFGTTPTTSSTKRRLPQLHSLLRHAAVAGGGPLLVRDSNAGHGSAEAFFHIRKTCPFPQRVHMLQVI